MRHLIASALVVATVLGGIVGSAFADPGEFDAPAQDVKASTETGTALGVRDILAIPADRMGSEVEEKHNLAR